MVRVIGKRIVVTGKDLKALKRVAKYQKKSMKKVLVEAVIAMIEKREEELAEIRKKDNLDFEAYRRGRVREGEWISFPMANFKKKTKRGNLLRSQK